MITGLFETHINVSNYIRSSQFYEQLLGILPLLDDPVRRSKFYWVGKPRGSYAGNTREFPVSACSAPAFCLQN